MHSQFVTSSSADWPAKAIIDCRHGGWTQVGHGQVCMLSQHIKSLSIIGGGGEIRSKKINYSLVKQLLVLVFIPWSSPKMHSQFLTLSSADWHSKTIIDGRHGGGGMDQASGACYPNT